jgi:hypothetical protein
MLIVVGTWFSHDDLQKRRLLQSQKEQGSCDSVGCVPLAGSTALNSSFMNLEP